MSSLSASQAAYELGTDAKTLRRFLRQDVTYNNAGSGGRYSFESADIPALKAKFETWQGRPKTVTSKGIADAPGLPARVARSRTRADRQAVKALSEERVNRLEAALLANGLHISQMRDRESWAPRVSA